MLIDVPCAVQSSIAGRPGHRRRDLHHQVRPVDLRRDPARLLERPLGVVGDAGLDLHRDVAVGAVRRVVGRLQHVAGVADVLQREREEDLGRIVGLARAASSGRSSYASPSESAFWKIDGFEVTPVTASSSIILFSSPESDEIARERVEPDRLPARGELMQRVTSPSFISFPSRDLAQARDIALAAVEGRAQECVDELRASDGPTTSEPRQSTFMSSCSTPWCAL